MKAETLRDLWVEPAPEASRRSRLDLFMVAVLIVAGLLDGLLSADVAWSSVYVPVAMLLPLALWWRRSYPLTVTIAVSSVYIVFHAAVLLAGQTSTVLNVGVIAVCLYTLARWASGRDAAVGIGIAVVAIVTAGSTGLIREVAGAVGLPVFLSLFVLAGISLRLWSSRGAARIGEAKMTERNRIARELHDTIAHHVSAIAVQAQGGQEILATNPAAAKEALAIIEQQASMTLAEMRTILGVLRDQDPADRTPQSGIDAIVALATNGEVELAVDVSMSGTLDGLGSAVESALFRLTQEAITNTRRHAVGATRVEVDIVATNAHVGLTITDDGEPNPQVGRGFGLLGMTERAELLGGSCTAGSSPGHGWVVHATIPRSPGQ